jgi:hypothetical protein
MDDPYKLQGYHLQDVRHQPLPFWPSLLSSWPDATNRRSQHVWCEPTIPVQQSIVMQTVPINLNVFHLKVLALFLFVKHSS